MNNNTSNSKTIAYAGHFVTSHFKKRLELRRISEDQVHFALLFGSQMYCGGARAYIVRHQDIPPAMDAKLARRYDGTVVITALDRAALITAYQNPAAYTKMKKRFRN